jgi:type IX secretion system PorP/SprF family membrane protein
LLVNPALSGQFRGNGRFMLNYRNQWSGVTGNPYSTYAFSMDRSFMKEALSAGVMAFQDKAGDAGMGITQVIVNIASRVDIGNDQYLKLGINGAWSQQSLYLDNLTWNSQFNGTVINPALNSGESLSGERFNYIDFSTGLLWYTRLKNNTEMTSGLSAFHISRPAYSYFGTAERLTIRWCLHADLKISIPDREMVLYPSVLIMKQGAQREITAGGLARFIFDVNSRYTGYYKASYLYLGAYYRYRDALVACARINYKSQFNIGISYDITLSRLSAISYSGGGIEISLSYMIPEKALFQLNP